MNYWSELKSKLTNGNPDYFAKAKKLGDLLVSKAKEGSEFLASKSKEEIEILKLKYSLHQNHSKLTDALADVASLSLNMYKNKKDFYSDEDFKKKVELAADIEMLCKQLEDELKKKNAKPHFERETEEPVTPY